MINISLCIETIFPQNSIYEKIQFAADAGYKAVEFWDPCAYDAGKLAAAASSAGVKIAGCTLSEPRTYQYDRPWEAIAANIRKSINIALELGCGYLIGLSSDLEGRMDSQKNIITENLKRSSELAVKSGVTLLLEPLNSLVDHKGCYLDSSAVGFEIIKCVDCPDIKLLYDIYHMQIMEGNLIANISRNIDLIGHFHAAGVPGRHEPAKSECNYRYILEQIAKLGYNRFVGLEYWPSYDDGRSIRDSLEYMSLAGGE